MLASLHRRCRHSLPAAAAAADARGGPDSCPGPPRAARFTLAGNPSNHPSSAARASSGGLDRLRGDAWPLVGRQFALQALQRASHAVLDSVAGDHAGGAAVAIRSGVDAAAQLGA